MAPILEEITVYGHENLLCTHKTTIEITKDTGLTRKGNCILGVKASKACKDLENPLREAIIQGKKLIITIKVDNLIETFYGFGDERLTLLNEKDIVFRKSDFVCDRTALVKCSKSSDDLNHNLINKLKTNGKKFYITFETNER